MRLACRGLTAQGLVRYTLKTPYRDGTTQVMFEPLDCLARLEQEGQAGSTPADASTAHRARGLPGQGALDLD